ncbi:hypothetical protein XA39_02860 [Acinetobacter tandoii]|jgi:hypothetical protein|uniref:MAE_28990/MAE_18760 family HEPN-like nuclease n=1 Tax=Acinetobacter tandoii TaxID=202954 RepID=UPI000C205A1D|nr:MAE_28990/MAE_18760 family HEPN-like nuclease [Acinetobacter tandoii]PJG44285.1 hypothetical protein XA39_02860 [Acinetobacter tandoii]
MFNALEKEIEGRLFQTKEVLNTLNQFSDDLIFSNFFKIQKGLLFVAFYASIEFTVTNTVTRFLELVSENPNKPSRYKQYILCTILNSQFNAIRDCSKGNLWDKRAEFMDIFLSEENVKVDSTVFPSDGINITAKQIKDLWKYFHLNGNALPDGIEDFLLTEIKNHRNAIAHGRTKAAEIGGRFSLEKLDENSKKVEAVCWHVLEAFKELYSSHNYLNQ